jgi:uncharacterized protein YndB with AHSA1/START domain
MAHVTGQTQDVGFVIGVSRTLPHPVRAVWDLLTSPAGLAIWLGTDVELAPRRGAAYRTAEGTVGEVRSFHELDRIRLTWQPPDWSHSTTVQVRMRTAGSRTTLRFHQEWLADAQERERQRAHWSAVLDAVATALAAG